MDYKSGSGSQNLVFEYTVGAGHTAATLDYKATNSLVAPSAPTLGVPVYENTMGAHTMWLLISGNYAYVAGWTSGLAIIDISDPTNPGLPVYSK